MQMQKIKTTLSFLVVFLFFAMIIFLVFKEYFTAEEIKTKNEIQTFNFNEVNYVYFGDTKVRVELAIEEESQARGLSGRESLAEDEGMLFVFAKPDKYFFWMKDMKFAIDMIWLDKYGKIIYIKRDARPETYPETFGIAEDAKFVLEVASGFSDKHKLKVGDGAVFTFE